MSAVVMGFFLSFLLAERIFDREKPIFPELDEDPFPPDESADDGVVVVCGGGVVCGGDRAGGSSGGVSMATGVGGALVGL
jgi:hypothetical protein